MCASKRQSKILNDGDGTNERKDGKFSDSVKASAVSDPQNAIVRNPTVGGVVSLPAQPLQSGIMVTSNDSSTAKASTISNNSDSQNIKVQNPTREAGAAPAPARQLQSSITNNGQATNQRKHLPITGVSQPSIMDDGNDAGRRKDTNVLNASKATPVSDGSSSRIITDQTLTDPNINKAGKAFPVSSISSSENAEVRNLANEEATLFPPTQPPQSEVVDNGDSVSQHKDPDISNASSPVSGGFKAQNIVVLGPTGGGASSVFNLIVGKNVASVSNDTPRCTTEATSYPIKFGGAGDLECTLHDIPVFNTSPPALPSGAINLAVVCMEDRTPQVKEAIHCLDEWAQNDSFNAPVLVVINHMSPLPDPNWWQINKDYFAKLRLVADHACLTRKEELKNTEKLRSLIIQLLSRHA